VKEVMQKHTVITGYHLVFSFTHYNWSWYNF